MAVCDQILAVPNIQILPPGLEIVFEAYPSGSPSFHRITSIHGEHWLFSNFSLGGGATASTVIGNLAQPPAITTWQVNGLIVPELMVDREVKQRNHMLNTNTII